MGKRESPSVLLTDWQQFETLKRLFPWLMGRLLNAALIRSYLAMTVSMPHSGQFKQAKLNQRIEYVRRMGPRCPGED